MVSLLSLVSALLALQPLSSYGKPLDHVVCYTQMSTLSPSSIVTRSYTRTVDVDLYETFTIDDPFLLPPVTTTVFLGNFTSTSTLTSTASQPTDTFTSTLTSYIYNVTALTVTASVVVNQAVNVTSTPTVTIPASSYFTPFASLSAYIKYSNDTKREVEALGARDPYEHKEGYDDGAAKRGLSDKPAARVVQPRRPIPVGLAPRYQNAPGVQTPLPPCANVSHPTPIPMFVFRVDCVYYSEVFHIHVETETAPSTTIQPTTTTSSLDTFVVTATTTVLVANANVTSTQTVSIFGVNTTTVTTTTSTTSTTTSTSTAAPSNYWAMCQPDNVKSFVGRFSFMAVFGISSYTQIPGVTAAVDCCQLCALSTTCQAYAFRTVVPPEERQCFHVGTLNACGNATAEEVGIVQYYDNAGGLGYTVGNGNCGTFEIVGNTYIGARRTNGRV